MSTFSQDCVHPVIIKEEGLEALADQMSSDSGPHRDHPDQDDDDDPDYQVDFASTQFILYFCKKARQVRKTLISNLSILLFF